AGPALSKDTYIRQAATLLLAEKATPDQLGGWCASTNTATRLAGVLASGFRLTLPPAIGPIATNLPLDASHTNEYLIPFEEGVVDMRVLARVGNFTVAEHWRAGKHTEEQEKLFDSLLRRLDDSDEQVRLQAAHFLHLLDDARAEPLVAKVCAQSEEPFPQGGKSIAWKRTKQQGRFFNFVELLGPCDQSSFYAYFRLESATAQPALLLLGSDDGVKVWHNGKPVWTNAVSRAALPYQDVVRLRLLAGGNDVLVRVQNFSGACGLYLDFRALGDVAVTLPAAVRSVSLAERMRLGATPEERAAVGVEFTMFDWTKEAAKGDEDRGKQLFDSLGCAKCHALRADAAGGGGPSLAEARTRFTVPYLAESILLPNKVVSPVFRATTLELNDGEAASGLVVGETAAKLELLLADGSRKTFEKAAIKSRQPTERSPMPEGLVRTPAELRDLLAYILSEQP
ncbi:MAG: c-type cytochrome, partial [Verrucomicrobia bacterium]|nr:c-type cytochrome [Verrucomicrobiota bacterium]